MKIVTVQMTINYLALTNDWTENCCICRVKEKAMIETQFINKSKNICLEIIMQMRKNTLF